MQHINEDGDSNKRRDPENMWFDLTTVHGHKYESDDFHSTLVQAGTLAFLRAYYPDASTSGLATDEIVVHHNMSIADPSVPMHVEFNPSKSYQAWGTGKSLIADKNEVKLKWNPTANIGSGVLGAFEPCTAPGTLPHWIAPGTATSRPAGA